MSNAKRFFRDTDFRKNALKQAKIDDVDSFPANARKGQVIYHNTYSAFFVCLNETIDTTIKGAWGIGHVTINDLVSEGQPLGKVLVTDGAGGFVYDDVDAGTLT